MEFQFDATAIDTWVDLCREESAMRLSGASEIDIFPTRMRVIVGMVNLLQNLTEDEKSNLVLFLLSQNLPPISGEEQGQGQGQQEPEDPSPETGEQSSQTTEQADQPSQDPP